MSMDDLFSLEGEVSPPSANGEVVFEAPWQARAFGMARVLCEQGLYRWDEFRVYLIHEINRPDAAEQVYFDHFLSALTRIIDDRGLCAANELATRSDEFAARPHGHDH